MEDWEHELTTSIGSITSNVMGTGRHVEDAHVCDVTVNGTVSHLL